MKMLLKMMAFAVVLVMGGGCASKPENIPAVQVSSAERFAYSKMECEELQAELKTTERERDAVFAEQRADRSKDMAVGWLAGPLWLGLTKDARAKVGRIKGQYDALTREYSERCE